MSSRQRASIRMVMTADAVWHSSWTREQSATMAGEARAVCRTSAPLVRAPRRRRDHGVRQLHGASSSQGQLTRNRTEVARPPLSRSTSTHRHSMLEGVVSD